MSYLLGIDLGTSSAKALLMDEEGNIAAIGQQSYTIEIPREGYADGCRKHGGKLLLIQYEAY